MNSGLIQQLGALAHPKRLDVFRLLMRRYPDSLAAGEVSEVLGLPPSTTSDCLAPLRSAGLVLQERNGTSLLYSIDLAGAQALNKALFDDCCRGRADICDTNDRHNNMTKDTTMSGPLNVLFICSGNSARSIMAEAILNKEGKGRFRAYSAGAKPAADVNPFTLELLQNKGYATSEFASKPLDVFMSNSAPKFDFIFTVCDSAANEECPAWPGQPVSAHWGMPDPVKVEGSPAEKTLAFQQAYGILRNRISAFTALPVQALDAISLQTRVDDIGRDLQEDRKEEA